MPAGDGEKDPSPWLEITSKAVRWPSVDVTLDRMVAANACDVVEERSHLSSNTVSNGVGNILSISRVGLFQKPKVK